MAEDSLRNVYSKDISASFRGILRVSPNTANTDSGLPIGESPVWISDSVGQYMPMKVSDRTIVFAQTDETKPNRTEFNGTTDFKGSTTINVGGANSLTLNNNGSLFSIKPEKPDKDDILIGDGTNFVQGNLREYIENYIKEALIIENVVPVGTIIYTALKEEDLTLLPAQYRNFYDFCNGQKINTATGAPYTPENYPDLYRLTGAEVEQDGMFRLPDLRNKFIRSASSESETLTIGSGVSQADITVPAHAPYTVDLPVSNPYEIKGFVDTMNTNCDAFTYHCHNMILNEQTGGAAAVPNWNQALAASKQNSYTLGVATRPEYYMNIREELNALVTCGKTSGPKNISNAWGWAAMSKYEALTAKETQPYSVALIPLIKVK